VQRAETGRIGDKLTMQLTVVVMMAAEICTVADVIRLLQIYYRLRRRSGRCRGKVFLDFSCGPGLDEALFVVEDCVVSWVSNFATLEREPGGRASGGRFVCNAAGGCQGAIVPRPLLLYTAVYRQNDAVGGRPDIVDFWRRKKFYRPGRVRNMKGVSGQEPSWF
jgi:hypothetical protein